MSLAGVSRNSGYCLVALIWMVVRGQRDSFRRGKNVFLENLSGSKKRRITL